MIFLASPRILQIQILKKRIKDWLLGFIPIRIKYRVILLRNIGAQEIFSKVSNAYSTLMDPEKRGAYDRYGPEEDRAP